MRRPILFIVWSIFETIPSTLLKVRSANALENINVLTRCSGKTIHWSNPLFISRNVYEVEHHESSTTISRAAFLTSVLSLPLIANAASDPPDDEKISKSKQTIQESISGLVAGSALTLTKTLVKYPLDTATVRLQMPGSEYSIFRPAPLLEGSYRGILTPLLANVPAGAVFFAVKDAFKGILRDSSMSRFIKTALAVAAAQLPYWIVRNPSEVVKTRQQANLPGYGEGVSAWDAYQKVRLDALADSSNSNSSTGLEGFYVGFWENVLYAYPADLMKFVAYDYLSGGRKDLSPAEGAIAGAASTAIAQLLTTPLDVIRNRAMAQKTGRDDDQVDDSALSYVSILVDLAQREGFQGLFAGASPRIGKALLSGAIQFATYEETKQSIAKTFYRKT